MIERQLCCLVAALRLRLSTGYAGLGAPPQATIKKPGPLRGPRHFHMAEWTGLEPATPGVTGRYSNQLNYHSNSWWVLTGSNRRPSPCKGDALPAELSTRKNNVGARHAGDHTHAYSYTAFRPHGGLLQRVSPGPLGRAAR